MSNRCKPPRRHICETEFIPDDSVDTTSVTSRSETVVTKVTVIRARWTIAGDKTAQAQSIEQFLHNLERVSPQTLRPGRPAVVNYILPAVVRGG
jgi:hypothetical protein